MAGYMKKLNGHVYEGGYYAGEAMANGLFAELQVVDGEMKVMKSSGTKDTVMRVEEKTTVFGLPAVVLTVTSVGENEVWLVEGEWDINDNAPYDESLYQIPEGTMVRMHRPLIGEQLIVSVDETLYGSISLNALVTPAADGTIAPKA